MEVKAQETTWVEERKVSFVKSHVTTNKYTYDIESISDNTTHDKTTGENVITARLEKNSAGLVDEIKDII